MKICSFSNKNLVISTSGLRYPNNITQDASICIFKVDLTKSSNTNQPTILVQPAAVLAVGLSCCYCWIQLCLSCCDMSKCVLCNLFTNLMGAGSLASLLFDPPDGEDTASTCQQRWKSIRQPKPLSTSSFLHTPGLLPRVYTCRNETKLRNMVGLWSKPPWLLIVGRLVFLDCGT